MIFTRRPANPHRSQDANNANTTRNTRKQVGFIKRTRTLLTAVVIVVVVATGLIVSGRAAGLGFRWPASVTKIFASRTTANTAPATRTFAAPVEPFAPLAVTTAWDFSPQVGGTNNFGPSPLAATSSDPNVTAGGLTRGSGIGTTG